jgi:hypothetical protein
MRGSSEAARQSRSDEVVELKVAIIGLLAEEGSRGPRQGAKTPHFLRRLAFSHRVVESQNNPLKPPSVCPRRAHPQISTHLLFTCIIQGLRLTEESLESRHRPDVHHPLRPPSPAGTHTLWAIPKDTFPGYLNPLQLHCHRPHFKVPARHPFRCRSRKYPS